MSNGTANLSTGANLERKPELRSLADLLLDENNPRFGFRGSTGDQADVLDHIVENFGVDDVMSSLAVNGYFDAEPMVCRLVAGQQKLTVVEGNRRLAACLIITGDPRANRQHNRTEQFQKLWNEHGRRRIDPAPVIIFDASSDQKPLLSYLGVRHISAAQPWDSYAKAAWVARVVEENNLSLGDVALMIGDQHRTITRLLQGYYFIQQTIESGQFKPEDSIRKGRGSVTDYPFSWVYTALGYSAVRSFLSLSDGSAVKNPMRPAALPNAGVLTRAMFGDRAKGRNAAISDSRELGSLAEIVADPDKVSLLEAGKTVAEIERLTQPIDQRLRASLTEVRNIQGEIARGLSEEELSATIAESLRTLASINKRTAADIEKRIQEAAGGDG